MLNAFNVVSECFPYSLIVECEHVFPDKLHLWTKQKYTQLTLICSKSKIKTVEKGVKYVQS